MLFICSHKTCPEHVEPCIFSMDDMDHAIGRTTVYRLLSQLVDDGVVRAWRDASRGITLYELSVITDCADVRCRKCERIFHLHCQALAALQASVHDHLDASHGFLLDPVAPQFTGLCPECRAKES